MGMFGANSRRAAGILGDALAGLNGQQGQYAKAQYERRDQEAQLQRQMALAQFKMQNPDPTATMQNVAATGRKLGTPAYQEYLSKLLMQPKFITLGNAENGQEVIDANNPPAASGPPAQAVQDLKSNPGSAAQFDEIFGQGAAARALGGQ